MGRGETSSNATLNSLVGGKDTQSLLSLMSLMAKSKMSGKGNASRSVDNFGAFGELPVMAGTSPARAI